MTGASLIGLVALLPAMVGPLPLEQGANSLILSVCGDAAMAITIPLQGGQSELPAPPTTPCCAKGCRSSGKKRVLDPRQ